MMSIFRPLWTRLLACALACAASAPAGGQQAPPPNGRLSDTSAPELILVSPAAKEVEVKEPVLNVRVTAASVTSEIEIRYTVNNSGGTSSNARKGFRNSPVDFQVMLAPGANQLTITAVNEKGASPPITVSVTYEARSRVNDDLLFLGVGISRYRDAGMQASFAESDVQQLGSLFKALEGGPVFDNVDPEYISGPQATRASLIKGLRWVEDKADEPDDVALVYISGLFGGESNPGGPYLLSYEHQPDVDPELTGLSVETILRRLASVKGRVVLLLEHAGTAGRQPDPLLASKVVGAAPENIAVCMAVNEGGVGPARERGALAEALLNGLRGRADSNQDRVIDLGELQSWLHSRSKAGEGFGVACSTPPSWGPLTLFPAGSR